MAHCALQNFSELQMDDGSQLQKFGHFDYWPCANGWSHQTALGWSRHFSGPAALAGPPPENWYGQSYEKKIEVLRCSRSSALIVLKGWEIEFIWPEWRMTFTAQKNIFEKFYSSPLFTLTLLFFDLIRQKMHHDLCLYLFFVSSLPHKNISTKGGYLNVDSGV